MSIRSGPRRSPFQPTVSHPWPDKSGPARTLALPNLLFKAGGSPDLRSEPLVESGLALHHEHAGRHRGMRVATKLGAVDLVAAFFDRLKPQWDSHAGDGVLGYAHGDDLEGVDDIFGTDITDHRLVHRYMHFSQPDYLDVLLGNRIAPIEAQGIGRDGKAHCLPAKLPALARVERVPIELLADHVDHRGFALIGELIHRLGPKRDGEPNQQYALDQCHRAFDVAGGMADRKSTRL